MGILSSKHFWIGFIVGYLLVAMVPAANLLAAMKKNN